MASAGRILIMPKGNYDSSATYEMLDLVHYNGTSWLAKKTATGIEPSAANSEYWHNLIDITPSTIGAIPKENLGQAIYVSNLMSDYTVPTFVSWDENTENTPYKHGLTKCTHGYAIIFGSYTNYQTIMAWAKGGEPNCFIHCVNGGNVYGWDSFLPKSGGVITGSTKIERTFEDATVSTELFPGSYALSNKRVSSLVHNRDGVPLAMLCFNETGAGFRDNVNNIFYNFYGEHNLDSLKPHIEQMIAEYLSKNS